MITTWGNIEVKQLMMEHYGYTFFVRATPMVVQPDGGGKWYDFELGCTDYGIIEYLFGIEVLDHEWDNLNYGFFETYIQDYMNEYIIEE